MTSAPDFEETRAAPRSSGDATLSLGTRLHDYEITGWIVEDAFSVVYLAWDHALHRKVAVEEYFPTAIAARDDESVVVTSARHLDTFKAGLASFVSEARQLASVDHPALLKVYRHWEDHGTAYRAMPFLDGPTLRTALVELGHVPSEAEIRTWLKPVLDALTVLHAGRTWHQNISPESILVTPAGPVLLGFASAAHAIEAIHHRPAAALRPGFAAIEQYGSEAGTTRGPWTDLYALAATVYAAITGADPAPAADRLAHDHVRPLSVVAAGLYGAGFLAAIDAAMAIQPQQRPADHVEFRALMGDMAAPAIAAHALRPDLMQEPFLPPPDEEREVTVPDPPRVAAVEAPAPDRAPASPSAPMPLPAAAPAVAASKTARAAPVGATEPAKSADRVTPSWMSPGPAAGKRMLYGAVAGTCALIGIAALVLQLTTRPAVRAPTVAAPTPAVSAPAAAIATTTAPAVPAATPAVPIAVPVPTPAPVAPAPPAPTAAIVAAPTDPVQRQARCIDILQKASLEKITAAETEYFKKECK